MPLLHQPFSVLVALALDISALGFPRPRMSTAGGLRPDFTESERTAKAIGYQRRARGLPDDSLQLVACHDVALFGCRGIKKAAHVDGWNFLCSDYLQFDTIAY